MAIKIKTRKFTMWNLLVINIGTMVGVGIFFKNKGVLASAGTGWLAIGAWIIAILTVLVTAISFFEIASSSDGERGTLANWGSKFISVKVGRLIGIFWNYIWYPVIVITIGLFGAIFSMSAIGIGDGWSDLAVMGYLIFVSVFLLACVFLSNFFSDEGGKWVQSISTIIKFIPLVLVAILAFANPVVAPSANALSTTLPDVSPGALTMILAIPGALFALDAFLSSINLQKEENKTGNAAKSTIISVLFVGTFYLIFAAGVFFATPTGNIFDVVSETFGATGTKLVYLAITISAFGVLNGATISWTRSIRQVNEDGLFMRVKTIDKVGKTGSSQGALKYIGIVTAAWFVLLIFSGYSAYGTRTAGGSIGFVAFIDTFSNVAVIGGFFTYAIIMISAYANRFTDKVKVVRSKWFTVSAPIAITLITLISAFVLINWFFNEPIIAYFIVFVLILVAVIALFNNLVLDSHSHKIERKAKNAEKIAKKSTKKVEKNIKEINKPTKKIVKDVKRADKKNKK